MPNYYDGSEGDMPGDWCNQPRREREFVPPLCGQCRVVDATVFSYRAGVAVTLCVPCYRAGLAPLKDESREPGDPDGEAPRGNEAAAQERDAQIEAMSLKS